MREVVIGHCVIILGQQRHQSLRHFFSKIKIAELRGPEHFDAELNEFLHLVLQNWEIEGLQVFKRNFMSSHMLLRQLDKLKSSLDFLVLLVCLPEEKVDGGELQFLTCFFLILGLARMFLIEAILKFDRVKAGGATVLQPI